MGITVIELNRRINGVIKDLESGVIGNIMTQVSANAIAMIRDRVQERGLNPEGAKYPDYSPGYKAFKIQEKKYRGFVDFTFEGRMFNNIKLVSPKDELDSGVAVIKATTAEDKEKLAKNTAKRGDILAVSESEEKQLIADYEQGILNIFRKNGLSPT